MSDPSRAPSRLQEQRIGSRPSSSPVCICGTPATSPNSVACEKCGSGLERARQCPSNRSACFDAAETCAKRVRGEYADRETEDSTPECSMGSADASSIITRGTRLKMSENAIGDRGRSRLRINPIEVYQVHGSDVSRLKHHPSEDPSLIGLPEELVLEIMFCLEIFDIATLRKINKRLSVITRTRVIWVFHLSSLLQQFRLPKSAATYLDTSLSTPAIEHIVIRSHAFFHKWFKSLNHQQNPVATPILSVAWNIPNAYRLPILLPGGRWMIVYYNPHPLNHGILLWDLENGKLKGLPEAQMKAEGAILYMDIKMDQTGAFAFLSVLTTKVNVAMAIIYRVDVYRVGFLPNSFGFSRIDTISLNERRAHEVQIYPEHGRVLVDMYDRVLIWEYFPMSKCAWIVTSRHRHHFQHFHHRSAHAITWTRDLLLVADGDESILRGFYWPPLFNRPTQLSRLWLCVDDPLFQQPLPHFSISLRFSPNRLVDISSFLESQESKLKQITLSNNVTPVGTTSTQSHGILAAEENVSACLEPFERGILFVDATACSSYLFCSYPLREVSALPGSSNGLVWTSLGREDMYDQTRRGTQEAGSSMNVAIQTSITSPFNITCPPFGHVNHWPRYGETLWVGDVHHISPSLLPNDSQTKGRRRTAALMRSPRNPGELVILSTIMPPYVDPMDLVSGQTLMNGVEQGEARTVLGTLGVDKETRGQQTWVEEASVDPISGRVCTIEMTTLDSAAPMADHACVIKLLEYA